MILEQAPPAASATSQGRELWAGSSSREVAWQSHFTLRPCSQSQCQMGTPGIALSKILDILRQPPSVLRLQGLHSQAGPFPD